ncbi:MAG: GPR endopeptidase [Clostridia bacterium]|nr:GPR endopeptidase [Clostridia bacterium]
MDFRSDLALEQREALAASGSAGVQTNEKTVDGVHVSTVRVLDDRGAHAIGKPVGTYITLETGSTFKPSGTLETLQSLLTEAILRMLPQTGPVLVVGLGNDAITPDALGPKTVSHIFATRHIQKELAVSLGLGTLRPVAAVAPGVLGRTGVETAELLRALTRHLSPAALIVIDALAARQLTRVGSTVQLTDSGISPGSGVGNRRAEISVRTLGVPVIAVGVPTVVDADTMARDLTGLPADAPEAARRMMVTPKEIDLLIDRAAALLGDAINRALQPALSLQELRQLTQ